MTARRISAGLALLALLTGGCVTAANTVWLTPDEGGKRVYGGVRADLKSIETAATGSTGMWVGGEEVRDRKRQVGRLLFLALDLPFSAVGDTLTLPYTLASEAGLFGWRGIYEPTTYPKALDERSGAEAPPGSEPSKGNALAQLAGNKFSSWTISRIEIARGEPTPENRTTTPLLFLEATDQPVAASFLSFSGSRDTPCPPSSAIRQFGLTGGEPMRGITTPNLARPVAAERQEWSSQLRLLGVTPVALRQ
jgi:uncharacterized protein YceK